MLDKFTRDELNRVDQYEHGPALFTLRHSSAAREIFAHLQFAIAFDYEYYEETMALETALECIAKEVACRHHWAHSRFNPRRVIVPGRMQFRRLADELNVPIEDDEYRPNRGHVKTIDGWWTV